MDAESNDFMAPFDLSNFVSSGTGDNSQSQGVQDAQGQGHGHGQGRVGDDGRDQQQRQQQEMHQRQQEIQREFFLNDGNTKRNTATGGGRGDHTGSSSQTHLRSQTRSARQGDLVQGLDDSSNAMLAALSANNSLGPLQVSMEALQAFLGMQTPNMLASSFGGVEGQSHPQQQQQQQISALLPPPSILNTGSSAAPSTQALLEQQLRLAHLQQLQQLQNQIFQQQIELISGQTGLVGGTSANALDQTNLGHHQLRDHTSFHGLPTPVNSTELRAQDNSNFVSPMTLQNYMGTTQLPLSTFASAQENVLPQGSSSAPAHLAFQNTQPLPSPGDLDFDLSPITSPWLGAYQQQSASEQQQQQQQLQQQRQSNEGRVQGSSTQGNKKRGASSSSGEDVPTRSHTRKKQSPAIRPNRSTGTNAAKRAGAHRRGTASLTSTPAMLAMSNDKVPMSLPPSSAFTIDDAIGDTPSPVDLSMPPPAPPGLSEDSQTQQGEQDDGTSQTQSACSSTTPTPSLAPVTPASIMNLGRLGTNLGLSPRLNATASTSSQTGTSTRKSPPKAKASGSIATKPIRKAGTSGSPALKPLLPGGIPASSAAHLATQSNYSHHISGSASSLNISPTMPLPQPTLQVRKTSHKAAEQKRRDSLKTTFDDLRLLLPPIPLPSEEGYEGEPPLPGAMPPRGPPRGEATGPNRAVSKLQLLRCGNQFIRVLNGRVSRRDEYIEKLKAEVRTLRGMVSKELLEGMEKLDLDAEIDAEEANAPKMRMIDDDEDE